MTRERRRSSFGVWRRERDKEEGERKRSTVRGGVREESGPSGGCRESVRKMTQLVELRNI